MQNLRIFSTELSVLPQGKRLFACNRTFYLKETFCRVLKISKISNAVQHIIKSLTSFRWSLVYIAINRWAPKLTTLDIDIDIDIDFDLDLDLDSISILSRTTIRPNNPGTWAALDCEGFPKNQEWQNQPRELHAMMHHAIKLTNERMLERSGVCQFVCRSVVRWSAWFYNRSSASRPSRSRSRSKWWWRSRSRERVLSLH